MRVMETYEEFIQNILDTRGRFGCGNEYHERHHIIPKCCNGGNEEKNLIDLFAKEHFIAHRLLALENPDNAKLVFAWSCMAFVHSDNQERYELTPEEYEEARIARSNLLKGRKLTEEQRKKISDATKGENNPNYGKHHSEETRRKIGQSRPYPKGEDSPMYGKHLSQERKDHLSEIQKERFSVPENHPWYGRKHTQETCDKISKNHADMSGTNNPRCRKVNQYNLDGNLIKTWDYIKQASYELHISTTCIIECCRGKQKTAGGYIWEYDD